MSEEAKDEKEEPQELTRDDWIMTIAFLTNIVERNIEEKFQLTVSEQRALHNAIALINDAINGGDETHKEDVEDEDGDDAPIRTPGSVLKGCELEGYI